MNAMNRREFLGSGIAAGIYSTGRDKLFPFSGEGNSYPGDRSSWPTPAWLINEPIVMAGCWDEFPLFQRRLGGGPTWYEQAYKEQGTEQTVKKLKEVGVTLAVIHFYKGFGLEAERPHIADALALSKVLKQNGIRVGLYVGSTIAYETFLLEKPEAEAWFVPDFLGKPVYYGDETFRKRVYFMCPGYREYIKKVVRLGIETFQADLIHFDNASNQAMAPIFQHPLAIQDFRTYLSSKYSPAELTEHLGFSDVKYVIPPQTDDTPATIDDPLFQEWADFRCHQLTQYYAEMSSFIHSLNPNVATDNNPSSGLAGVNTIWNQGVDYPRLLRQVDMVYTEEGNSAAVSSEGVLVSKIRTFKMAAPMNKVVACYTYGSVGGWGYQQGGGGPLQMSECMAYNRHSIGMIGGFHDVPDLPAKERGYVRFFLDSFQYYRGVSTISDVALLYSYSTMAFNNGHPLDSFMLASQMMIQNRLLFDIIFDEQLENLSKYSVLFLADQESLSDRQIELIREFVVRGGGLVATGQTSLYTEWRRRRRDFGLKDCFEISAPAWNGPGVPEAIVPGDPVRKSFGKGRVVYVPEIIPSTHRPISEDMTSQYWTPAVNHESLRDAVLWAIRDHPTVRTESSLSPYVTVELAHQEVENRLVLHMLNYDHARNSSVQNIQVEVAIPGNRKVKHIQMLTPDNRDEKRSLDWSGEQSAKFTIPSVEIYTIAVLDME
jgi:hypothetical protein